MPNAYHRALGPTPQNEPLNDSMVANNAGGYSFKVTPEDQFRRFLILGSEGGTYYVSERKLTKENIKNIQKLIKKNPEGTLSMIKEVSLNGLAPRVSPTILALAIACSVPDNKAIRKAAFELLPVVLRTNSHMLEFISYVDEMRGWGRLLRESVSKWYNSKSIQDLDYQLTKYNNRSNWTTRDVLRMAKPVPPTELHSELYGRVAKSKKYQEEPALSSIDDRLHYFKMSKKAAEGVKDRYQFVLDNKLTREMVPTEWLNDPKVFRAFLDGGMPLTAMIRSLGPMTSYGVFTGQEYVTKVCNVLNNAIMLKQARVHPMAILLAMTTYKSGRGFRGGLSWQPKTPIIDALDSAFYNSWGNVTPSNKRIMIGLDVSGSMGSPIMNTNITCRDASVAMCMITKATEPQVDCFGFSTSFMPLDLSPRRRLDDNVRTVSHLPFAGTDCSLPMMEALKMKNVYDAFVIYTDSETWAGRIHPVEALAKYRRKKNPEAKLVVVGMTSNGFTIADPKDSGMMDVVGFDASAPSVISNFLR